MPSPYCAPTSASVVRKRRSSSRASCGRRIGGVATSICDCRISVISWRPSFLPATFIKAAGNSHLMLAVRRSTTKYSSSMPKRNSPTRCFLFRRHRERSAMRIFLHRRSVGAENSVRRPVPLGPIFGMKDDAEREVFRVADGHGFDGTVVGPGFDLQFGRQLINQLTVQRVHLNPVCAEDAVQLSAAAHIDSLANPEAFVLTVRRFGGAVLLFLRQVFRLVTERAPEGYVQFLKTAAGHENGNPSAQGRAYQRQRGGIPLQVEGAVLFARRVSVMTGMHVREPARHEHAIHPVQQG